MADRLDGKTTVVTDASSGIGRASATRLAAESANVVLGDIDAERGREAVSEVEADGGDATFVTVDVTDADDVRSMAETARETYGGLGIAHNNVGIEGDNDPLPEQSRENWGRVFGINLTGVWLAMKHKLPALMEDDGGAIINTSPVARLVADGNEPYVASKHGVVGLTKSAIVRCTEEGVRVNTVCPGVIRTPTVERSLEANPGAVEAITAEQPLGRMAEPEEIASAVAWLASEDASFVNGHALPVDGGKLAWTGATATRAADPVVTTPRCGRCATG